MTTTINLTINLFIAASVVLFLWLLFYAVMIYLDYRVIKSRARKQAQPAKIIVLHDKRVLEAKEVFS